MNFGNPYDFEIHARHRMEQEHAAAERRALLRLVPPSDGSGSMPGGLRRAVGCRMIALGEALAGGRPVAARASVCP